MKTINFLQCIVYIRIQLLSIIDCLYSSKDELSYSPQKWYIMDCNYLQIMNYENIIMFPQLPVILDGSVS